MDKLLNCIAIDDEPFALDLISAFCSKIRYVNLLGTFLNPFEAVQTLNNDQVDLMFLDKDAQGVFDLLFQGHELP